MLKDVLEDNGYTINVGSDRIEYAYTEGRTTHHGSISRFTQDYDNIVSELKSAELSPYYNMLMNW